MLSPVFIPAEDAAATIAYASNAVDATNATSYTLAVTGLSATGLWVVGIGGVKANADNVISSATIDGQSIVINEQLSTSGSRIAIGIAESSGSTSGNVVVNFNDTMAHCGVAVWNAGAVKSSTPVASDNDKTGNPFSRTIATQRNGILVAYCYIDGNVAGSFSWTGPTEDFEAAIEGDDDHSGASMQTSTSGSQNTQVTYTAGGGAVVVASWR